MSENIMSIISSEIDHQYENSEFNVSELCKAVNMSRATLFRKCTRYFQKSPHELIDSIRMAKAKELLDSQNISIRDIAYDTGFNDSKYFSRKFKNYFGVSPRAARA